MIKKKLNPSEGWPHECPNGKTWVKTSETQMKIVCSFCRKLIGVWDFTYAEESKTYPTGIDAKFTTEQKHDKR